MRSYWESDQFKTNDFSIIGAGILGLFTAYELSIKYPKARIAIYERDAFAAGATTKNAGFACFGSLTEIASDKKRWGDDISLEIVRKRWQGIERIQSILGHKIDYENLGGYELILDDESNVEELEGINHFLHPIFNQNVFRFQTEKIKEFGFGSRVKKMIYNSLEGQIHSGKLILAMHKLLHNNNVQISTNSELTDFCQGESVSFSINGKQELKTKKLIFCTNAFPPEDIKSIKPGRGQVLITRPIPNLKLKGCFHFHEGYYYFRNVDNRILFGGGRQLDFEGETDTRFLLNNTIQADLIEKLTTIILPNQTIEIDSQWSGIMAFSEDKLPLIQRLSDNVIYAMNCNGMGVSLSPITAKEIVDIV
jgi:glycine/D-amino acid oxidase-like deaminating enzyme